MGLTHTVVFPPQRYVRDDTCCLSVLIQPISQTDLYVDQIKDGYQTSGDMDGQALLPIRRSLDLDHKLSWMLATPAVLKRKLNIWSRRGPYYPLLTTLLNGVICRISCRLSNVHFIGDVSPPGLHCTRLVMGAQY